MLNIRQALIDKGVSTLTVAKLLGVTEKTAYNKIMGKTDFNFNEAIRLADNVFPEYSLRYLYSESECAKHDNSCAG